MPPGRRQARCRRVRPNLGRDHMDYHPTIESYMAAKMRLFDTLLPKGRTGVIFADDAWSEQADRGSSPCGARCSHCRPQGRLPDAEARRAFPPQTGVLKSMPTARSSRSIFRLPATQVANALVAAGPCHVDRRAGKGRHGGARETAGRIRAPRNWWAITRDGALAYVDYARQAGRARECSGVRPAVHHRPCDRWYLVAAVTGIAASARSWERSPAVWPMW